MRDYTKPRAFTIITTIQITLAGMIGLATLPLWILPVWLALRDNHD